MPLLQSRQVKLEFQSLSRVELTSFRTYLLLLLVGPRSTRDAHPESFCSTDCKGQSYPPQSAKSHATELS